MRLSIDPSEYCDYAYNTTILNERAIELVLARRFLITHGTGVLEVGAVTPYYWDVHHEIADPFDTHPKVSNRALAENLDYTNRAVLSISTIEHIGELGDSNACDAYNVLERIYSSSKHCLITFPMGAHPNLQDRLYQNRDKMRCVCYVREGNLWHIDTDSFDHKYPSPYGWAGAIAVVFK